MTIEHDYPESQADNKSQIRKAIFLQLAAGLLLVFCFTLPSMRRAGGDIITPFHGLVFGIQPLGGLWVDRPNSGATSSPCS